MLLTEERQSEKQGCKRCRVCISINKAKHVFKKDLAIQPQHFLLFKVNLKQSFTMLQQLNISFKFILSIFVDVWFTAYAMLADSMTLSGQGSFYSSSPCLINQVINFSMNGGN